MNVFDEMKLNENQEQQGFIVLSLIATLVAVAVTAILSKILFFLPFIAVALLLFPLVGMSIGFLIGCIFVHGSLYDRKDVAINLLALTFYPITCMWIVLQFVKPIWMGFGEMFSSIARTIGFLMGENNGDKE